MVEEKKKTFNDWNKTRVGGKPIIDDLDLFLLKQPFFIEVVVDDKKKEEQVIVSQDSLYTQKEVEVFVKLANDYFEKVKKKREEERVKKQEEELKKKSITDDTNSLIPNSLIGRPPWFYSGMNNPFGMGLRTFPTRYIHFKGHPYGGSGGGAFPTHPWMVGEGWLRQIEDKEKLDKFLSYKVDKRAREYYEQKRKFERGSKKE